MFEGNEIEHDKLISTIYSKQRMDGDFGFFARQDAGNGYCEFENSWVWSLE